jgi:biopolymer transport protein ExbB
MLDVLIDQLSSAAGPVLAALLLVSVLATTVSVFKIVQFRALGVGRSGTSREATLAWSSGDLSRALEIASRDPSPATRTVLAAMRSLERFPTDQRRAEEAGMQNALAQLNVMRRHLRLLEAVVQAAPMMGLLGTVLGMISAFSELSRGGGAIDPSALASGIWTALLTTAVGLTVAIPFYLIWTWLDARTEQERVAMESALGAFLVGIHEGSEPIQSRGAATAIAPTAVTT